MKNFFHKAIKFEKPKKKPKKNRFLEKTPINPPKKKPVHAGLKKNKQYFANPAEKSRDDRGKRKERY